MSEVVYIDKERVSVMLLPCHGCLGETVGGLAHHMLNRGVGRRWVQRPTRRFGLETTFRPQARPRKECAP
jgi:hypothetical protein